MTGESSKGSDRVILSQFRPSFDVLLYLRLIEQSHHINNVSYPCCEATGDYPQLQVENKLVPAGDIIDYLKANYKNLDEDAGISVSVKSQLEAFTRLIEMDLHFCLLYYRYYEEEHYHSVTKKVLKRVVPFPVNYYYPPLHRREVKAKLNEFAFNDIELIKKRALAAYKSLNSKLSISNTRWVLNTPHPTSLDCVLFGHLAQTIHEPLFELLSGFPKLLEFHKSVHNEFFVKPPPSHLSYTTNGHNYFLQVNQTRINNIDALPPIPTAAKRKALSEEKRVPLKVETEEELQFREDSKKSLLAALGVVVAYIFYPSVIELLSGEADEEFE